MTTRTKRITPILTADQQLANIAKQINFANDPELNSFTETLDSLVEHADFELAVTIGEQINQRRAVIRRLYT